MKKDKRKFPLPFTQEHREKIGLSKKGKNHPLWKAHAASYTTIHFWVRKWKKPSNTCEKCGRKDLKERQIDWANIDHKYRRVLDDYIRLCRRCHWEYDREMGFRKHKKRIKKNESLQTRGQSKSVDRMDPEFYGKEL